MIAEALRSLRPNSSFTIVGEEYSGITWLDTTDMPSYDEVMLEIERLTEIKQLNSYKEKRMFKYPPMTQYLDAVYWQSQGDDSKMTEYLAAVAAVKERYPKPEGV
jgi:hypothetical protein